MELSTEDKQRIEQANRNEFMPYKAGWIAGAEYATIYEREDGPMKQHVDGWRDMCSARDKRIKQLEAERADLLAKVSELQTQLKTCHMIDTQRCNETSNLIAKVSEQETQLDNLIKENAHLAQFLELSEKLKKQLSEQSQRIEGERKELVEALRWSSNYSYGYDKTWDKKIESLLSKFEVPNT